MSGEDRDHIVLMLGRDPTGAVSLWSTGAPPGRERWPIEYTGADADDLEAGHEVVARAYEERFVTDRARAQHELDDAAVRVLRRDLDARDEDV